jgi:hypothetical protein
MDSESIKSCCASICTVVSAVAIPVLVYIALLCGAGSRLIEIPQDRKTSAAVGCWVAAAMYVRPVIPDSTPGMLRLSSYPTTSKPGKPSNGTDYPLMVTNSIRFLNVGRCERQKRNLYMCTILCCAPGLCDQVGCV